MGGWAASQGFVTTASSFLPTPLMVWGPGVLLPFWSHHALCLFLDLCSTFLHEAVATSHFTDGQVKAEETHPKLGSVAGLSLRLRSSLWFLRVW